MRKYRNKPVKIDGIRFDSKKEAKRYGELKMMQRAGEIRDLKLQVPIDLQGQQMPIPTPTGRVAKYVADFTYFDIKTECNVIEDVKGMRTDVYKLKRGILKAMGIEIKEILT